eukprot:TRINITY_DN6224_c0_g1_i2.p1 TRINITY_DN6224_c0_g1~~TRINITY_DN6224_c0_g1_i2.p1  ORF type:complete len:417 (-),score=86.55 TRINITY_DN6224_c0_g1_i2:51-1301(-)
MAAKRAKLDALINAGAAALDGRLDARDLEALDDALRDKLVDEYITTARTIVHMDAVLMAQKLQCASGQVDILKRLAEATLEHTQLGEQHAHERDIQLGEWTWAQKERPSLQAMYDEVEGRLPHLRYTSYTLRSGQFIIDKQSALANLDLRPKEGFVAIAVIGNCRPFSDFDRTSGLALLGVDEVTSDEALFPSDELDLGAPLPDALTRLVTFARWSSVRDVLQHLAMDMAYRVYTTPPADIDREACLRDLISPVLSAAALLVEGVTLVADFSVAGLRSHGSIDWVLQFKKYSLVGIAAKLGTVFAQHVGQLAAEMLAARESYAMKVLGKCKQDAAKALEQVPTYGIVTNGLRYQFFKYVAGPSGQRKLVASKMVDIMLTARDLTDVRVLAEISGVLGPLVHIVRAQVEAVNAYVAA